MPLFTRRFTPAYDILQAKKRAGAPSFAELDNSRLLPKNGSVGQVPVVQANGAVNMEDPSTGMTLVERMNYLDLLNSHNELRVNAVMEQLAFRGVKFEDLASGHSFDRNPDGARIRTILSDSIGQVDLGYASDFGWADGKPIKKDNLNLKIQTNGQNGSGIHVSPDETRFWTTHKYNCIIQWRCEVAGDLSTAKREFIFSVNIPSGEVNTGSDISFSDDGYYMLLQHVGTRILYSFKLNEPFDARHGLELDSQMPNQGYEMLGYCWGDSGNKVYALYHTSPTTSYIINIVEFTLSNPYKLNTVTSSHNSQINALATYTTSVSTYGYGLAVSTDGTRLFWTKTRNDVWIGCIEMSQAWTLSSGQNNRYIHNSTIPTLNDTPNTGCWAGVALSANNSKMWVVIDDRDELQNFTLDFDWHPEYIKATHLNTVVMPTDNPTASGSNLRSFYSNEGQYYWIAGSLGGANVHCYKLSTPYDRRTMQFWGYIYTGTSSNYYASFNADGTKVLFCDSSFLRFRNLSTAYDLDSIGASTYQTTLNNTSDNRHYHFNPSNNRLTALVYSTAQGYSSTYNLLQWTIPFYEFTHSVSPTGYANTYTSRGLTESGRNSMQGGLMYFDNGSKLLVLDGAGFGMFNLPSPYILGGASITDANLKDQGGNRGACGIHPNFKGVGNEIAIGISNGLEFKNYLYELESTDATLERDIDLTNDLYANPSELVLTANQTVPEGSSITYSITDGTTEVIIGGLEAVVKLTGINSRLVTLKVRIQTTAQNILPHITNYAIYFV